MSQHETEPRIVATPGRANHFHIEGLSPLGGTIAGHHVFESYGGKMPAISCSGRAFYLSTEGFLEAARVPASLEPQECGPWTIERVRFNESVLGSLTALVPLGEWGQVGWPSMTMLSRHTAATLHRGRGEVVMEDSRRELARHLPIFLAARGRVLISGLGLGCVVRGLLFNPEVTHIDVVEIDPHIITILKPEFRGNPRVTIHYADALTIEWPEGTRWDYAWHDIWSDKGHGKLCSLHVKLMVKYAAMVGRQGAWQMPREIRRRLPDFLGGSKYYARRHRR